RHADDGGLLRHQVAPRARVHPLAAVQEEGAVPHAVPQDVGPRARPAREAAGLQPRQAHHGRGGAQAPVPRAVPRPG
ncbi:hypothetical protein BN1723_020284, partial [Verticillium longisporum]